VIALRKPETVMRGVTVKIGPISHRKVPMDQALMTRCLENLMSNALQAITNQSGEIRITAVEESSHLAITFRDNGPGVPPHMVDHIFDPEVSGRVDGSGLGLTFVKGVIEAHGGYINYETTTSGGACFVARLPLQHKGGELEST
jgi:signal transduction histidine kinase